MWCLSTATVPNYWFGRSSLPIVTRMNAATTIAAIPAAAKVARTLNTSVINPPISAPAGMPK